MPTFVGMTVYVYRPPGKPSIKGRIADLLSVIPAQAGIRDAQQQNCRL
jgi:hypothetical protein